MSVPGRSFASLLAYGVAHAVVDAISAGALLTLWHLEILPLPEVGAYFILYNALAFGAQPLLGLVVDWTRKPRHAAIVGCGLTVAAAVLMAQWPMTGVIGIGIGNAVFHLGAGSIALNLTPGRAAAPGIFVAPGALGLFLGTHLGQAGSFVLWPFGLILAGLCMAMLVIPLPEMVYSRPKRSGERQWVAVMLVLVLGCVMLRSLVGFSVVTPWKSVLALAVTWTVAIALGKAVGGVLADRLGWGRIAVGTLMISAVMLAFGANVPAVAIAGMFLFNCTMPVTLAATANLFPGRPAFAFGLTCLALEIGAWRAIGPDGVPDMFGLPWVVFGMVFGSAVALYIALRIAFQRLPAWFEHVHV